MKSLMFDTLYRQLSLFTIGVLILLAFGLMKTTTNPIQFINNNITTKQTTPVCPGSTDNLANNYAKTGLGGGPNGLITVTQCNQ